MSTFYHVITCYNGNTHLKWEYCDEEEDGEYEWEYEEEEEEAPAPVAPKETPKPEPPKAAAKTEEPPRRRERPKVEVEETEAPRRRERPKIEVEDPEPPKRLGRSDRNDILEQMKRLQEGYKLDVEAEEDDDDISYSLSDDDDDDDDSDPRPKKASIKIDDEDLEDMELLDPFGDDPIPKKKDVRFCLRRLCRKFQTSPDILKSENLQHNEGLVLKTIGVVYYIVQYVLISTQ